MNNRREGIFWGIYAVALVLLFLLSSTDLIIKEREPQVYGISVIVEDNTDDNYINFRKGMEKAAIDYNADVSFITLYDEGNQNQQEEFILREQEDGCRALVVSPVDAGHIMQLQAGKRISVPLILLNSELSLAGDGHTSRITFDYYQMGRALAEQALAEGQPEQGIYLLKKQYPDQISRQFEEGILSVLTEAGREPVFLQSRDEGEVKEQVEKIKTGDSRQAILLALDPMSLGEAALALSDQESVTGTLRLYGRGTTVRLLNYLDRGIIRGLSITDDFTAGYLSVKTAVELADNQQAPDRGYLDSHYIRKEDLRSRKYEKLLYPIE